MKAVRLVSPGSLSGLKFVNADLLPLERHEVRIRVRAASLNFRDTIIATGRYPGFLKPTPIPLSDGAGEVVEVGSDVSRAKIGDRVTANCTVHWIGGAFVDEYHMSAIGMTIDGMLAEYCSVHENAVVRIPNYLRFIEAASLPCAAVSAWSALNFGDALRPGHTVLVQGTGGVALFALQLARASGARVLAITSSAKKAEYLKSLGAEHVINYHEIEDWDRAIMECTSGRGVDKVVDIAGEATINRSAACTRYGGEIGLVGFVSGFGGGLPPLSIMARSLRLQGIAIGSRQSFEAVLDTMEVNAIHPIIDQMYAFADFRSAYERLQSGNHVGKVVVEIP